MKPKKSRRTRTLRTRAEKIVAERPAAPPDATYQEALHELRVHQVELELQVEELRHTEDELQRMRDRYMSLYDNAPVGYLTLDRHNVITQANIAASKILGIPRPSPPTRRFSSCLEETFRSTFFRVTAEARASGTARSFDALLVHAGGPRVWVKMDFTCDTGSDELRMTLVDITERRRAEKELRELADGLIGLQEKERQTVAEALHDDAGQQLTYLSIILSQARQAGAALDAEQIDQLGDIARKVLREIRALSASLSPTELKRIGLPGAVQDMIAEFMGRTRIPVTFAATGTFDGQSFEVSLAAYRIVQEALTNAARHARPSGVSVSMDRDGGRLSVQVRDDGSGFSQEDRPLSLGLLSMRERARTVGGKLEVQSSPGKGTRVSFFVNERPV